MRRLLCSGITALLIALAASPAWAQTNPPRVDPSPSIRVSAERLAARMSLEKVQPAPRKDPVRNGVVVGAVVGGVTAFAWMGVMYRLCESFDETGGGCKPSFPRAALPVTIFGAGAGGLIGFLIDSLR